VVIDQGRAAALRRRQLDPLRLGSSGRWWRYDESAPARDVAPLLAAIDDDVTGIFWG